MAKRLSKERKDEETVIVTQAERIIKKFGSAQKLNEALKMIGCGRRITAIYRWTYAREKGGTGGIIPSSVLFDILQAGRKVGIELTSEDLDIRPVVMKLTIDQKKKEKYRNNRQALAGPNTQRQT